MAMVATLQGVIDWGTKLTAKVLGEMTMWPAFLKNLASFSVVRFALWQRIDSAPPSAWSDRPMASDVEIDPTHGVPVEIMVEVANQARLDPWFCMPHWADDAYVRSFAELVKSKLAPERTIYVEHSNDVTNSELPQHHYLRATAIASMPAGDGSFDAAMKSHVARSLEIFRIWEDVLGGKTRLVRVLGAGSEGQSALRDLLELEPIRQAVDAIVVGPVLEGVAGEIGDAMQSALKPFSLFQEIASDAWSACPAAIASQVALASRFRMRLFVPQVATTA